MITYDPFWKTIHDKNISTYALINTYHISSSTISRLRKNQPLSTTTINDLCEILECMVEDVLQYVSAK